MKNKGPKFTYPLEWVGEEKRRMVGDTQASYDAQSIDGHREQSERKI